jgi:hypothetical protein
MTTKFETQLAATLDIDLNPPPPVSEVPAVISDVPAIIQSADDEAEHDFQQVRENLTAITVSGQEALDTVIELAKSSEQPRAFEVVSQILGALATANRDLLAIHIQREKLRKSKEKVDAPTQSTVAGDQIQQNIFVGSTKDLQDILSKRHLKTL